MENNKSYLKLISMTIIHFIFMFVIMYSAVYIFDHAYFNLNKIYMALIMTIPMISIEIFMMSKMYPNKIYNYTIVGVSLILFITFFLFIRSQTAIEDKQFLRSMIPHHSSAILMCDEANITDPEIKTLCDSITAAQIREIKQMEQILSRLNK